MEQKTHWKSLVNNDYIGAYTLMQTGQAVDLVVKITNVTRQQVKGEGGKSEECTVATLEGQKPFIVNRTNAKTITKIYDSPYIQDWIGKTITLFVARVKVGSDTVDALRIRPVAPKLPELTPTHESWDAALTAITAGSVTIEAIKKKYIISPENEAKLTGK